MTTDNSAGRRCVVVLWGTAGDTNEVDALAPVRARWPDLDCYRVGGAGAAGTHTLAGGDDLPAALSAIRQFLPATDCLLLRHGVDAPEGALRRLQRAFQLCPDAVVVSPMSDEHADLWPLPAGFATPPAGRIDAAAALCRPAQFVPTRRVCAGLSLWRTDRLAAAPDGGPGTLLDWLARQPTAAGPSRDPVALVCNHLFVGVTGAAPDVAAGDPRDRPAAGALAPLRSRLEQLLSGPASPLPDAGLQARPVCLHVIHCWGGGIAQWTESVAAHWPDYDHLVLVAWSNPGSEFRGQELRLHATRPDGALLGRWTLPAPIRATALTDSAYRAVLDHIVHEYCVDSLCISSLIGHSLDVLRTGLPAIYVFHDYYPLWPDLGLCFERSEADFSAAALPQALKNSPFAGVTESAWRAVRDAFCSALGQPSIRCLAPSRSVPGNLPKLTASLDALDVTVIAHGLVAIGEPLSLPAIEPGERLRLLLPGRVPPSKGRDLLLAALPGITEVADVYLLGASRDGHEFFGLNHVHVVLEYRRDNLAELIATLRPHLALALSTVSETFNLTLSEMWSLGLPVLATRVGALGERIEQGVTGWLVEPEPAALVEAVRQLAEEPQLIQAMAASDKPATSMAQAVAGYRSLLPAPAVEAMRYPVQVIGIHELAQAHAARALDESGRRAARLAEQVKGLQKDLEQRTEWADRESQQAREHLQWAEQLQADLSHARQVLDDLTQQFDERTAWAQSLRSELDQRDEQLITLNQHLQQRDQELQSVQEHLQTMLNSRSWRLTRPLRRAGRLLRAAKLKLGIQSRRAAGMAQRTRKSLKIRGLAGTVDRIGRELKRGEPAELAGAEVSEPARDYRPLTLPTSDSPEVSVVIPAYRHYEHTHACLNSLVGARHDCQFEVIVVDDASDDDETGPWLLRHEGIVVLTHERNSGFIDSCNRGAAAARGEFLVFLNNDTAVSDHWLDRLLEPFTDRIDTGLVGARLIYPDGRLQEAGGIIFSDGSGWNYGRLENPGAPQFCFLREVDYCSGAAIMLRRELFEEVGGFDTRYRPAYYEDVDLAFEVRERGLRVLYQPTATVTHFEGVSSGTDTSTGTKRFQPINQAKLVEKWRSRLTSQPAPGTPLDVSRRHRRPRSMLVIDACTPRPDHDAGSVRMVNLMQIMLDLGWHVRFMADNRAWDENYTPALQQMGVEALYHPHLKSPDAYLKAHGKYLDAVLVSRHYVARNYVEMVRLHCPKAQLLFDTVDLHYLREQRQAELEGDESLAATARKTRARELDVARRSDLTLVVSEFEKDFLAQDAPDVNTGVLSTIVTVVGCRKPFAERKDLLFIGGFQHPPNIDAVRWFAGDIMPLLQSRLPDIKLHVIGSRATAEVRSLASSQVLIHGFVPDIEPWLDGCRLSLAPLRFGAGVKGKINTAMSYGQPVIATSTAVEGMHVRAGEDVLTGDTPQAFADAIVAAYQDPVLWDRLSRGGLHNVQEHFSFAAATRALKSLLDCA